MFAIDKNQPVSNVTTMQALVDRALARSRFLTTVLGVLAAAALALAALGIYGVLSYSVAQRQTEIGIRIAIGATPARIIKLVTSGGLRLAVAGAAIGFLAAAALSRLLSSLLFEIKTSDPWAYAGAALALLVIAAAACLIPAWRAAATDPLRSLQAE